MKNDDRFIPIGFVATYFSKEKSTINMINDIQVIQKTTVLTNDKENYYLIHREEYSFSEENEIIRQSKFSGPFKMYSEYDLQNLNHLQQKATIQQNQDVDISCLAAMYCGQNVFSIFFDNKNILAYLARKITE